MRKFMVAVAVVLMLVGVIILSLPYWLDLNRYRDQYLPILEGALDRKVEVEDIRLTLFPTLGVQLRKVAVSDDPAFSTRPFLTVPSMHVAIQWKPLLQRRIQIENVVVENPSVQIIRLRQGVTNISTIGTLSTTGGVSSKDNVEPRETVSPLLGVFAVEQFSLIGGALILEDRMHQPSKVYQIDDLTMKTESVAIGKTAQVQVQGLVRPYHLPINFTGHFGPLHHNFDIAHISIEGLVGKVSLMVGGKLIDGKLTGDIHIPKASTGDIPIEMGLKKPIELSDIQAHFLASIFSRSPQTASAEVAIDLLRLNLHLGRSTINLSGKGTPSRFFLVGDAPTVFSEDLPVSLPIQQPFSLEHIQFEAEIQGEKLTIKSLKAKMFDGAVSAQGVLGRLSSPFTFSTQGTFQNFSTESLLKVMRPSKLRITGAGDLKWKVKGLMPLSKQPKLDGPTRLTIRDGAIIGFDLVKIVEDALKISGVLGTSTGSTKFSLIDARMEFEKDGLAVQNLMADASNVSLQSSGKVGLNQSVYLQGTLGVPPDIAEKIIRRLPMAKIVRKEGQFELPFIVRGTVQDPIFRLDTQLLGNQVKKKIEKRLEKVLQGDNQELQKLLDEGKDLLKHFFRK